MAIVFPHVQTEIERDLILTSLRLYQDVLRVKDLSSVNTDILAKEMGNPRGMSSALNLVLNASKHSGKQLLMKNTARQVYRFLSLSHSDTPNHSLTHLSLANEEHRSTGSVAPSKATHHRNVYEIGRGFAPDEKRYGQTQRDNAGFQV